MASDRDHLEALARDFWEASHDPDEYINTDGEGSTTAKEADYALDVMCQRFADVVEIARDLQPGVSEVRFPIVGMMKDLEERGLPREAIVAVMEEIDYRRELSRAESVRPFEIRRTPDTDREGET